MSTAPAAGEMGGAAARWRVLALVCAGVVFSMGTWFSATAITPELIRVWNLSPAQASWLTSAVQIGFVAGALASSFVSLPDLVSLRKLMGASALLAALSNLSLLWVPSPTFLLWARFATGAALAGVYPPSLKLISTWFQRERGTALGAVIAALTLGSAFPHLIRFLIGRVAWQSVVISTSAAAAAGALLMILFATDGPFPFSKATFDPRHLGAVIRNRPLLLANFGYFGHMWELYAMWGLFLAFASAAMPGLGFSGAKSASLLTFSVVASGVVGALLGGVLADRIGRTATTALMMTCSGFCALTIGFVFDGPAWLFLPIAVVWGMAVIGDSAQFSAMATEVGDPRYVGTALAFQLGLGFALTVGSLRLTPMLASAVGWRWAFLLLVPGPIVGVTAILILRGLPEAKRIAHGLR